MKVTSKLFLVPINTLLAMVVLLFSMNNISFSQEKAKLKLNLNYLKKANGTKTLIAELKAKEEKRYQPVSGVEVNFFYINKDEENQSIGGAVSNEEGKAIIILPSEIFSLEDTANQYIFLASVTDNEKYNDNESDLTIRDVNFKLSTSRFDSLRKITTFVSEIYKQGDKIQYVASPEVEVNIFIQRMFSLLPIGKGNTDANGEFSIDFPIDLPGDSLGNVTIVSKVIENEMYGNLEAQEIVNWGVPVKNNALGERELWSARANAPYYLILIVNLILTVVWGYIAYIIYQLIRIYFISKRQSV